MTIRTLVAAASLAMMLAFNVGHAGAQAVGSETDTFINNLPAPGAGASYIDETGILLGDDVEAGPIPVPYPNTARTAGSESSGLPTDLEKIDEALLPELFAPQPTAAQGVIHAPNVSNEVMTTRDMAPLVNDGQQPAGEGEFRVKILFPTLPADDLGRYQVKLPFDIKAAQGETQAVTGQFTRSKPHVAPK